MKVTANAQARLDCEPVTPEFTAPQGLPVAQAPAGDSAILPPASTAESGKPVFPEGTQPESAAAEGTAGAQAGGITGAESTSSPTTHTGVSTRCAEHARVWGPARREAVESYIAYLQSVLRLQDWTITIDWAKPSNKDALATITQMTDSKHATLRLSPEFTKEPPQLRGQILLHEMIHCHLFQMESLASTTVSVLTDKRATAVFNVAYTAANECATDAFADAFYSLVAAFHLPDAD